MPVLFAHLNLPILWRALAPGPAACGIGGGRAGGRWAARLRGQELAGEQGNRWQIR